jgi:hypothetical protein
MPACCLQRSSSTSLVCKVRRIALVNLTHACHVYVM